MSDEPKSAEERCWSMTPTAWSQCVRPYGHAGNHEVNGLYWRNNTDGLWTAEYWHEDGRRMLCSIKADSYTAAKVCARNGEQNGFTLSRVVAG